MAESNLNDFEDLNVVVTGGAGALGTGVVAALLGRGASCHIPVMRDEELADFPFTDHERISIVTGIDLAKEKEVQKFYQPFTGGKRGLWASVHCAGGFSMGPIADTDQADFEQMIRTNAQSCFLTCRAAVSALRQGEGGGRVVNVAARPGLVPDLGGGMVAYTASKAAVAAMTQALASEVAGEGIWVNAVAPSIMDTPANRKGMPDADHESWPSVEQVASTVAFLASPLNGVTRGAVVPVYGKC